LTGRLVVVSVGAEQRNDNLVVLFQSFLCLTGYDNCLSFYTEQMDEAIF
jgi:hypothetical protein